MTDEQVMAMFNELLESERLIATIDESGEPFYPVASISLSQHTDAEIAAGKKRKFILWLDGDAAITEGEDLYR